MNDHERKLLAERHDLLLKKYGRSPPRFDEIEAIRFRAISYELDIIDFDSPAGQALDAVYRMTLRSTP